MIQKIIHSVICKHSENTFTRKCLVNDGRVCVAAFLSTNLKISYEILVIVKHAFQLKF